MKRLAILSLWAACGRSGELAYVHWDGMSWDHAHECVVGSVPQVKTSKKKNICFVAGADRSVCWILALGDHWATSAWNVPSAPEARGTADENEPAWLFDVLHDKGKGAGAKMGTWIALGRDEKWALTNDIPPKLSELSQTPNSTNMPHMSKKLVRPAEKVNAAGIRKGAVDLMATYMPNELVVAATGHDLSSVSALDSYIQADAAKAMAGAVVLAGFAPFPWGHRGKGPTPASWDELVAQAGDEATLDAVADVLFHITSESDAALASPGGRLRPLVRAALAHQVMYLEERHAAGECAKIVKAVIRAFADKRGTTTENARHELFRWAGRLRTRFEYDNFNLLSPGGREDVIERLVSLMRGLHAAVGTLQATMGWLQAKLEKFSEVVANVGMAGNVGNVEKGKGRADEARPGSASAVLPLSPLFSAHPGSTALDSSAGDDGDSDEGADPSLGLRRLSSAGRPKEELLSKMKAMAYFRQFCLGLVDPDDIPVRQLKKKAHDTVRCFKAVATKDELAALANPEAGFRLICRSLEARARTKLYEICAANGLSGNAVPHKLRPKTKAGAWVLTTVDTARSQVLKVRPGVDILKLLEGQALSSNAARGLKNVVENVGMAGNVGSAENDGGAGGSRSAPSPSSTSAGTASPSKRFRTSFPSFMW